MSTFSDKVETLIQMGLCDHCLGRQVGMLTSGTSNDERGRALRLFLAMEEQFDATEKSSTDAVPGMKDDSVGDGSIENVMPERGEENEEKADVDDGVEGGEDNNEEDGHERPPGGEGPGDPDPSMENDRCPLCKGLFTEIDTFTELIVNAFSDYEFDTYLIGSVIDEEIIQAENDIQTELGIENCGEGLKSEMNRVIGLKVYDRIGKEVSFERPDIVGVIDTRFDSVSLQLSPVFLYGRYQKFDRTIPQTIWNCKRCRGRGCEYCNGTGKIYQTSVQEIIGDPILEKMGGTRHLFHGMGREDIDARMLGNGRPFILEISNPRKRNLDPDELMDMVNRAAPDRVMISGLSNTIRDNVSRIKNIKSDKSYLAEVEFDEPVTEDQLKEVEKALTGTVISQRTPTRVAHRRSDLVRERKVININCRLLDDRHSTFTVRGESGLYIKELIHGNEGRTEPSVSGFLGIGCRVVSLDVLSVHYDEDLEQG